MLALFLPILLRSVVFRKKRDAKPDYPHQKNTGKNAEVVGESWK